jgi:hypothetical protein
MCLDFYTSLNAFVYLTALFQLKIHMCCLRACVLVHVAQDTQYSHLKRKSGEYCSTGFLVVDQNNHTEHKNVMCVCDVGKSS